jgi:hypothetical protein
MSMDSPLQIQPLEKYRATMTKEEVAEALGLPRHIVPPLTRAGLLKPLGRPQRYCVKHYSRDELARSIADVAWLDKLVAAIHRHWRIKNARKRVRQAGNPMPNGSQAGESVPRPVTGGMATSRQAPNQTNAHAAI